MPLCSQAARISQQAKAGVEPGLAPVSQDHGRQHDVRRNRKEDPLAKGDHGQGQSSMPAGRQTAWYLAKSSMVCGLCGLPSLPSAGDAPAGSPVVDCPPRFRVNARARCNSNGVRFFAWSMMPILATSLAAKSPIS